MFKRILMPLDGSEEAERLTGWLIGCAATLHADVELMAVIDLPELELSGPKIPEALSHGLKPGIQSRVQGAERRPVSSFISGVVNTGSALGSKWDRTEPLPDFGAGIVDSSVREARKYLHHRARFFEAAHIPVSTRVVAGHPAVAILSRAKARDIDLIVLTSCCDVHKERGSLGKVAAEVLRSAPVPVLTFRPQGLVCPLPRLGKPDTIVVPLDGSSLSETAVPAAMDMARTTEAEMLFVRVVPLTSWFGTGEIELSGQLVKLELEESKQYLETFVKQARAEGIGAGSRVAGGNPSRWIVEIVDAEPGALAVMSTHGASGFRRWVLGSVTEEVVRNSGNPVLVLPPGSYATKDSGRSGKARRQNGYQGTARHLPEEEVEEAEKAHEADAERARDWAENVPFF